MINLEELNALYEKGTQGEWRVFEGDQVETVVQGLGCYKLLDGSTGEQGSMGNFSAPDDAALIVALRNAWPAIYKELIAGRELVEAVRGMRGPLFSNGSPTVEHEEGKNYGESHTNAVWTAQRDAALAEYDKGVKV